MTSLYVLSTTRWVLPGYINCSKLTGLVFHRNWRGVVSRRRAWLNLLWGPKGQWISCFELELEGVPCYRGWRADILPAVWWTLWVDAAR